MQDKCALPPFHAVLTHDRLRNRDRAERVRHRPSRDFTFTHNSVCTGAEHLLHVLRGFNTNGFDLGAFANHHSFLPFALDETAC